MRCGRDHNESKIHVRQKSLIFERSRVQGYSFEPARDVGDLTRASTWRITRFCHHTSTQKIYIFPMFSCTLLEILSGLSTPFIILNTSNIYTSGRRMSCGFFRDERKNFNLPITKTITEKANARSIIEVSLTFEVPRHHLLHI